jgi:hypothetical protein
MAFYRRPVDEEMREASSGNMVFVREKFRLVPA